jgi:hypothetical protein
VQIPWFISNRVGGIGLLSSSPKFERESSCTPFSLAAQGESPGSLLLSPVLADFITRVTGSAIFQTVTLRNISNNHIIGNLA